MTDDVRNWNDYQKRVTPVPGLATVSVSRWMRSAAAMNRSFRCRQLRLAADA